MGVTSRRVTRSAIAGLVALGVAYALRLVLSEPGPANTAPAASSAMPEPTPAAVAADDAPTAPQPPELEPWTKRELNIDLPQLGTNNPQLVFVPERAALRADGSGKRLTVVGDNSAGLWFVLGPKEAIYLVDDVEREVNEPPIFPNAAAFASELARQNRAR
jgi:hypothetical protein